MATASDLKEKVTKILKIVEGVDNEHVNLIEKDILLQEVRELYSDIMLLKTDVSAPVEPAAEVKEEIVEETPVQVEEKTTEPPVIAIPFDDGDFDFHELLKRDEEREEPKAVEPVVEEPVVEPVEEPVAENNDNPVAEEPVVEEQEVLVENEEESPEVEVEELSEDIVDEEPQTDDGYFEESSASSEFDDDEQMDDDDADDEPVEEFADEQNEETEQLVDDVQEDIEPVAEPEAEHEETVVETPVAEPAMPAPTESVPMPEREPEKQEAVHLTLGEQLGQSRQESLNDRFANNKPIDLSSRIGLKPITDIKAAIGLGERYRFTRMLFSGNGAAFDSTVASLNGMSNIEEAENYLRTTYNWDMESPIVADFMNIVRRRYL